MVEQPNAIGTGETPYEAVRDLTSPDSEEIERVDGLRKFSDRIRPTDQAESRVRSVTIIPQTGPIKQWQVVVDPQQTDWEATFNGAKVLWRD